MAILDGMVLPAFSDGATEVTARNGGVVHTFLDDDAVRTQDGAQTPLRKARYSKRESFVGERELEGLELTSPLPIGEGRLLAVSCYRLLSHGGRRKKLKLTGKRTILALHRQRGRKYGIERLEERSDRTERRGCLHVTQ